MSLIYEGCKECLIKACCSMICHEYIEHMWTLNIHVINGTTLTKEEADKHCLLVPRVLGPKSHSIIVW